MRGIGDILGALFQVLPVWANVGLGALLLLFGVRGFDFRTRHRQVKEAVRRLVRAEPADRPTLVARAYERAGEHPELLGLLVAEARRRHMPVLADEALARLDAVPGGAPVAARLRAEVRAVREEPLHPLEVAVRVRALLDEGLVEAARARLGEGLAQHPSHPELLALADAIAAEGTGAAPAVDSEHPRR